MPAARTRRTPEGRARVDRTRDPSDGVAPAPPRDLAGMPPSGHHGRTMTALRATLFNLAFVGWTIVLGVVGLPVRALAPGRALALARLWVTGTIRLLRVIGGIRILVGGRERLGDGAGHLVAAEHRAGLDSLVWLALVPRPSYVMKQELRSLPLVGPLLEPAGMIAIDRQGGAKALRGMLKAGRDALERGRTLVIFPEGTRAARTGDVKLQGGITALAGRGAHPVLPVATNSGEVWGPGFLLRMTGARPAGGTIRILIGAPIETPDGADPREAIAAAWHAADAAIRSGAGAWSVL